MDQPESPRVHDAQFLKKEGEPLPKYPIFLTGGAGATGQVIAERFALEGYPLIIGTRSLEKFEALSAHLKSLGGVEPRPFIADITNSEEVSRAYNALDLGEGEPVHFFSLAAEGIKKLRMPFGRIMVLLLRGVKNGELTRDMVLAATEKMRDVVSTDEAMQPGLAANFEGPRDLATMLVQRNHLHSGSRIVTLSSLISHDTNPDKMDEYTGPFFYIPIGVSKELGVRALRGIAIEQGIGMLDVVAPGIQGTEVADFLESLVPILQALEPGVPFAISSVSKSDVANAMYAELSKNDPTLPLQRTVFVGENGNPTYTRPSSWGTSLVPYL